MSFQRITNSLKNLKDRIRASINIKSYNILFFIALCLVFFLAVFIRLSPMLHEQMLKAFDPWMQYYNTQYIATHTWYQYFHWFDYKSWYPTGIQRATLRPGLVFTAAILYQIINGIGIHVSLYNVCYYFPPFMGGVTTIAIYFLGKEVLDKRTGLFAAFFLAFSPGFMQRTVAGFFDNETIGVFSIIMCLLFFVKTLKSGKLTHAIIGGVFLGYLSLSWGGEDFIYFLIPVICVILILLNKYDQNVLIGYAGVQGTGLLIGAIIFRFKFTTLFSSINVGGIFFFTLFLVFYHLFFTNKEKYPNFYRKTLNVVKWAIIPAAIILASMVWISPDFLPFGFGRKFQSILSPLLRNQIYLIASVAEQIPSPWSTFYYNTLIPLTLVPLGIYFAFRRLNSADIIIIIFVLTLLYFTGSMIRIILILAPAVALVGAYGLVSILNIFGSYIEEKKIRVSRKRKRQLKSKRTLGKTEIYGVFFLVGFLSIAQVVHATDVSINQLSYSQIVAGGVLHDWEESLTWMRDNLPGKTVVVSWWDYGYWLTPIGNITSVNDGNTLNSTRIGLTGMALMQTNELDSAKIFKKLKADYVLVYFGYLYNSLGGDEGKWQWMIRICNDHTEAYKKMGLYEPNWAQDSVFNESSYVNSTGYYRNNWFQSTLVKLLFYGVPTDPSNYKQGTLIYNYAHYIQNTKDAYGNTWASHIPTNGNYDFKVFDPAHFSTNGLVKIYKIDYTALDSNFTIQDPKVYNNGIATFNLQNTGTRNLTISNIQINGKNYTYSMGTDVSGKLGVNKTEPVWIDLNDQGTSFSVNDVVKVNVTAQAQAEQGKTYTFSRQTSNFFVKEAKKASVKINKLNSKVIISNDTTPETKVYLEVENNGGMVVNLNSFYIDNETNTFSDVQYTSGSPVLRPGQKADVILSGISQTFLPIGTNHSIGVTTVGGNKDEVLFSGNLQTSTKKYGISIIDRDRIVAPELSISSNGGLRKNIPVQLNNSYAYTYDNGTTELYVKVKNTGNRVIALDTVTLSGTKADDYTWNTINGDVILGPGEENIIKVTTVPNLYQVNDNVGIMVSGDDDGARVASDVGYLQTIASKPQIDIIDKVLNTTTSYIAANETGKLLIKNTGNQKVTLDGIYLNNTLIGNFSNPNQVTFLSGDKNLGIQNAALVAFNITGFELNQSNIVNVNVTTYSGTDTSKQFKAYVDNNLFNVSIDKSKSSASYGGDLVLDVSNLGLHNVTIDSVYINQSYISIANFNPKSFEMSPGSSTEFTLTDFGSYVPFSLSAGDTIKILVRTQEGAEDFIYEII